MMLGGIFKPLEEYIQRCVENDLRIRYLVAMSLSASALIILCYVVYETVDLPNFLHAALIVIAGGFLGTFISILERSKRLSVGENDSPNLIILQGTLRVCIGGVFGLIAYAAAISELAFSLFKGTSASLILLGVAAGFSERLIPDLIKGISTGKDVDAGKNKEGFRLMKRKIK